LSLTRYSWFIEASIGPARKVVERLASTPDRLGRIRADFESLVTPYYVDNQVHQGCVLTRANAR